MGKIQYTEKELREDFIKFMIVVWYYLALPPPTKIQLSIARYMCNNKKRDRIIEAYRGVGKSYIAYAYAMWRIWNNNNINILVISGSAARANEFSSTCQRLIDLIPFLNHLKPDAKEITYTKVMWTVADAKVSGSPTVKSVGITGQITGTRADLIIADDVEVRSNSGTIDQREKLRTLVTEFEAIRKGDESGQGEGAESEVLYLGTPQTAESLYNHQVELGFDMRVWPARYPRIDKVGTYKGRLDPEMEEELYMDPSLEWAGTDIERFSEEELSFREVKYGKSGFSLQFMLDTELSDADKYPLRTEDLVVYTAPNFSAPRQVSHGKSKELAVQELPRLGFAADRWYSPLYVDPVHSEYEEIIMSIDPSGRGLDETSYAIGASSLGTIFVRAAGGFEGGYDMEESLKPLAYLAKEYGVTKIVIESNFGDGMFTQLFTPIVHSIHSCTVEEVRHSIQKEKRIIDTLEPLIARHKLIIGRDVIEQDYKTSFKAVCKKTGKTREAYSLFYQLTHITYERQCLQKDDRIDALAILCAGFTERLNRDLDLEIARMKNDKMQVWIDKVQARERRRMGPARGESEALSSQNLVDGGVSSSRVTMY